MLITIQSFTTFSIAAFLAVYGAFSQQLAISGAGAVLAGGVGSTNLVGSRRKNSESSLTNRLADIDRKVQTAEKLAKASLARESHQNAQIDRLTNDVLVAQENIDRLNHQVQVNTTRGLSSIGTKTRVKDSELVETRS